MNNFVTIVRGGVSYCEENYGTIAAACAVAKRESLRYPEAKVYCGSSDRALRICQVGTAVNGKIVEITTRYCGKVVTSDETIPDELWEKFNDKRF